MAALNDPRPDDTPRFPPRQAPPVDMNSRTANVLARLDIERMARPRLTPDQVKIERLERRVAQLEMLIEQLA